MKSNKSATLDDVARTAGVSPITVSRALRLPEKVSAATRERVLRAISDTGYIPNLAASMLASQRSSIAAAIFPTVANPVFADTLSGINNVLNDHGYSLVISQSGYDIDNQVKFISAIMKLRPCGIFMHNTMHTAECADLLADAGLPVYEIGDLTSNPIDSVVSFSNFKVGRQVAQELFERGYRRMAFASEKKLGNIRLQERFRGYKEGLAEFGLNLDYNHVFEGHAGTLSGSAIITKIKNERLAVDAIFFAGELMGIGASLECSRLGIKVPDDIALLGLDDYDIGHRLMPPLSAVAIPRRQIGVVAAEALVRRLSNSGEGRSVVDVGFSIKHQGST